MKTIFKCRVCKKEISITAFKKSNRKKSGYESICKKCHVQKTLDKRKKDKLFPKKENSEYLIKHCSKHGNLKYEDIGLHIYQNTNPIVVDLVCLKCLNARISKKYNNNNMLENMKNEKIVCQSCSFSYPINNYYRSELKRKSPTCTKCIKKKHKPYKDKSRLKLNFNLTGEQYNKLLIDQNSLCKICKHPETIKHRVTKKTTKLAIDHCHKTGKIRGLLCRKCNLLIGNAKDSPSILMNAIEYLKND